MATIIQAKHRDNHDRHQRWMRLERADLLARYGELHTQGVSQRQAAKVLDVPRSTLQAWRAYHDRLDACPAVVAFFQSVPGLAFLHQLVMALHLVCVEIGACGIRLVCLFWPTFKGGWSTAVNFAPLPSPDTTPGRYPQPHRRSDDSPGHHGLGS